MVGKQKEREIRVFISSTFLDMQEEREVLVKKIFPRLRKICEQRRVAWSEVDLRWGITDEQKAEGSVLPLCLAEIDRCRPYFIGILGERYGWVDENLLQNATDTRGWIREYPGRSITDLEITYGVLRNPGMARHAFFYFRDPVYVTRIPEERRNNYVEAPIAEDISKYGTAEAERRARERSRKLRELKKDIVDKGLPVRQNYPDPAGLGELVFEDLRKTIDELYPEEEAIGPLELERLEHDAFARARFGLYISRSMDFNTLDAHARGDGPPLAVTGESGSGKSALLANWYMRYKGMAEKDDMVLVHFIGATPASADLSHMLRRIMTELKSHFELPMDVPEKPDELKPAFHRMLEASARKGRAVLILDAINQFDGRDGALELDWLPPRIPSNIRMIVSTLPGKALEEVKKRGYDILEVRPLDIRERSMLIHDYLSLYGKRMKATNIEHIAASEQTSNPLFLRSLLNEIRIYGDWKTLDRTIDYYLSSRSPSLLLDKILNRYEQDYGGDMVRRTMSLILASRKGLYEAELLDLLGTGDARLPMVFLAPLLLAAEHSLISRSGLLCFGHEYMKKAVQYRYFPVEGDIREVHLRLADYFEGQELSLRKIDELPWHLAESKSWDRLANLLANPEFFCAAWHSQKYDVKAFWAMIEGNSDLRVVDAYRPPVSSPSQYSSAFLLDVSSLLAEMTHYPESLSVSKHLLRQFREKNVTGMLPQVLGNIAAIYSMQGELETAIEAFREKERICRGLGDKAGVISALIGLADVYQKKGDFSKAYGILKEQSDLSREIGDKPSLKNSLIFLAVTSTNMGNYNDALPLWREAEKLCRELGDKDDLARALSGQNIILTERGEIDQAFMLIKQSEQIGLDLGNRIILARAYYNLGNLLKRKGDLEGSLAYFKKHEALSREVGAKNATAGNLCSQASIYRQLGRLDEAMALLKESEKICRDSSLANELKFSLGEQGLILAEKGDLDGAMGLFKEEEGMHRNQNNNLGVAESLGKQAMILKRSGDPDRALMLLKEEERICRTENAILQLQACLEKQSEIYRERPDLRALGVKEKELVK